MQCRVLRPGFYGGILRERGTTMEWPEGVAVPPWLQRLEPEPPARPKSAGPKSVKPVPAVPVPGAPDVVAEFAKPTEREQDAAASEIEDAGTRPDGEI